MSKSKGYPILRINREKIYENAKRVVGLCAAQGITVSGVIKGANGIEGIAEEMLRAGCTQIASSRLEQLIDLKKHKPEIHTMLLRIPMISEINDMIKHVDLSLNSECQTVEQIEKACEKFGKRHGVILMMDLGDLREGFFNPHELYELALHIEYNLKQIRLIGIGTNLGCYGSVKPTKKNLGFMCHLAERIETAIGRKLEVVSGGATTSLPLLVSNEMPAGINNLRIGEAILLNMDLPEIWKVDIGEMNSDTFILEAQIVEIKSKPTHPLGDLFIDAFGNMPDYPNKGIRKRALLALGNQDFAMQDKLVPIDKKALIVGSSSDHMIVDIEESDTEYKLGDIMQFKMYYGALLHLCSSEWVRKIYR